MKVRHFIILACVLSVASTMSINGFLSLFAFAKCILALFAAAMIMYAAFGTRRGKLAAEFAKHLILGLLLFPICFGLFCLILMRGLCGYRFMGAYALLDVSLRRFRMASAVFK